MSLTHLTKHETFSLKPLSHSQVQTSCCYSIVIIPDVETWKTHLLTLVSFKRLHGGWFLGWSSTLILAFHRQIWHQQLAGQLLSQDTARVAAESSPDLALTAAYGFHLSEPPQQRLAEVRVAKSLSCPAASARDLCSLLKAQEDSSAITDQHFASCPCCYQWPLQAPHTLVTMPNQGHDSLPGS